MKIRRIAVIAAAFLLSSQISIADTNGLTEKNHKYWLCAVSTYRHINQGNDQEYKCRANTEYSEPPCREFLLEFEGVDGIRPGAPFKQTITQSPTEQSRITQNKLIQPVTTTIEINEQGGEFLYTQTVEQAASEWVYKGPCHYYEAPLSEKIYRDKGLKTGL